MKTKDYAYVAWGPEDVCNLKPEWTTERAEEFLWAHESDIQEVMIQRGWQAIEDLLARETEENKE